jgi:mannose-1-phosphate guanylyltransferase/phosphomannomutase
MDHGENRIHLEFIGASGANIDRNTERKLEAALNNDDYKRVSAKGIQRIRRSSDILQLYFAGAVRELSYLGPGKVGPTVVLGAQTDHLAFLGSSFLKHIGCRVHPGGGVSELGPKILETGADLGVFLAADGETIVVLDEEGRVVGSEDYRALATLVALETRGESLVVPHDAPGAIGDMASSRANVVRVKSGSSETMAEMVRLGETDRRVALQYLLSFDGLQAAGRIVDFLVGQNFRLSRVLKDLPILHFSKQIVPCKWSEKGRVLRELVEEFKDSRVELYEGVKVFNRKGWALVLPDSEKPHFNIYAEGHSVEFAEELSAEFASKVNSLLKRKQNSNSPHKED